MTAQDYGFHTPQGSDLISQGDNDISYNAERTAYWFDQTKFDKKQMATNTDVNNLRTPGNYYTGGASAVSGMANLAVAYPSAFLVLGNGSTVTGQVQIPYAAEFAIYYRATASSTSWHPWQKIPLNLSNYDKGTAIAGTNFDEVYTSGSLYSGGVGTIETQLGLAEQVPSNILTLGNGTRFVASQIQIPVSGDLRFWVRSKINSTTWTPWKDLAMGGGATLDGAMNSYSSGAPNLMRIQAFKDEYPLVSTGNKGAVVFRYDHGLTNLKSTLLPLHQAAGIPFYVAMNSRNWTEEENSGATQADAKSWITSGIAEFGNHTADHRDRNTADGIYDAVVNGRKELESQLGITIHGFTVPGLSEYNKFEGFGSGTLNSYSDTLAGSLILANHAISSGVIGSTHRTLDGEIRQGGRHYTWEQSSFASIQAQVDSAIANKTALTLMAHPRNMNASGYWTPTLAAQVIDYVKTKIDAGELANISYYQSHHATL